MNPHTREERESALKKLPKPVADFFRSNTLTNIYLGIAKKHKLNWRELSVVSEITNFALIGLAPESGIETSIHQNLPELSNAATHELVADINDRVFKEAKRRLRENIVELEEWDETELGPKPKEGEVRTPVPTIEELKRMAEEEAKQGGFKHPEDVAEETREKEKKELEVSTPVQVKTPGGLVVRPLVPEVPPTVVEQKLAAPTVAKPEEFRVQSPESRVEESRGEKPPEPPRKADPYREQVD